MRDSSESYVAVGGKCSRYPVSNRLFGPQILFGGCAEQKEAHLFHNLTFDMYQIIY